MAILLMKLRQVPEDELIEILRLLDDHAVDYYQTSAGPFGVSLPALWLRDEARADEVKGLLDEYAERRQREARQAQAAEVAARGERRVWDMFRESPFKFSLRVLLIVFFVWLSVHPFFQ
jgi:hypothetical protein